MLSEIRKLYIKAKSDLCLETDILRQIESIDQTSVIKNIDTNLSLEFHKLGSLIELGQILTAKKGSQIAINLIREGCETGNIELPSLCKDTPSKEREKTLTSIATYLAVQEYEQQYREGRLFKLSTLVTVNDMDWKLICTYPKDRKRYPSVGKLNYVNFSARPIDYNLIKVYLVASKS